MSPESASRTFIGSIVCVDLVGYSTKSVAQQIAIKGAFNRVLTQVLAKVPEDDRIILDTGDGAAISFLGDPEATLGVGLALRDATAKHAGELGAAAAGESAVRIGINLGPVRLGVDLNGYPKIIGDGLNVAERVTAFAQPGQIAVSRSFYEMVSRLSDANAACFRYEGARTDKNAREHQIYVIDAGVKPGAPSRSAARPAAANDAAPAGGSALVAFLEDKVKVGFAAGLLVALIAVEVAFLAMPRGTPGPVAAAPEAPPVTAPATAPAPAVTAAPPPVAPAQPQASAPVTAKAVEPAPKPAEPKAEAKAMPAKAEPKAPEPARAPEPKAEAKAAPPKIEAKPAEPPKAADAKPAPPKPEAKAAPAKAAEPKSAPRKEEAKAEPPRPAPAPAPVPVPEPPREEPKAAPPPSLAATPVSRSAPNFPPAAAAKNIDAGTVKARLTIDAAGRVKDVQILESRPRRFFDEEASRSLREWRFNPGADNRSYDVEIAFQR